MSIRHRSWLPLERRFAYLIYQRGDCWEWRASKVRGYGVFYTPKQQYAHRVAYEIAKGFIPDGYTVDHLCRHRWCVRPSHLEVVTLRENILRSDSPSAKQARRTACIHGHPFTEENTYLPHRGGRQCRICKRKRDQKYQDQNRDVLNARLRAHWLLVKDRENAKRRAARHIARADGVLSESQESSWRW